MWTCITDATIILETIKSSVTIESSHVIPTKEQGKETYTLGKIAMTFQNTSCAVVDVLKAIWPQVNATKPARHHHHHIFCIYYL